jgi:protein ImuA
MHAAPCRQEDLFSPPAALTPTPPLPEVAAPAPALKAEAAARTADAAKPWAAAVDAALWRGHELGRAVAEVQATGFAALDRELPGGGWPCRSLTELLQPQPGALEWRLLGPALRAQAAAGRSTVLVAPPWRPHLPGLRQVGLDERHLVWVQAGTVAERLWCTEQLIKANAFGALVAWLPQARPEQVRRLQVCALASDGLVFLCRPAAAQHESSAAPLRVLARPRPDWMLELQVLKRRGPALDQPLQLHAVPGSLQAVLTRRTEQPSRLRATRPRTRATAPPSTATAPRTGTTVAAASRTGITTTTAATATAITAATTTATAIAAATATATTTATTTTTATSVSTHPFHTPASSAGGVPVPEGAADAVGSTAPATRPRGYSPLR